MINYTVRDNLMNTKHYSPYCGGDYCSKMPRTKFNGKQFYCDYCGWVSEFPQDFIISYKEKWELK